MTTKTIPVSAKRDHIESMVSAKRPLLAVAELVWNGLDADATRVTIEYMVNDLSGIDEVTVEDNGLGIPFDDIEAAFGSLGGSWKKSARQTARGRSLHGKSGKGRFRAFGLGTRVVWTTRFRNNGDLKEYAIRGDAARLDSFEIGEPLNIPAGASGTNVSISGIQKNMPSLLADSAIEELAEQFAVYLAEYRDISIVYNGTPIDPSLAQILSREYNLKAIALPDGTSADASLTIIEWKTPEKRTLYLCDEKGISLHEVAAGIQAPGYSFTAYLKSPLIRELDGQDFLIEDMHPTLNKLLEAAKGKLREHFRQRQAECGTELVKEWQDQHVYPYEGEPTGEIERAERQVFDVVAVSVNSYLPSFDVSSQDSKRLTFGLIKQALRENPKSLGKIIQDVLNLPKDRQDDFALLLERATLPAIIAASKVVTDRLDFLKGLEFLVFDKEMKKHLKERQQLHKILEQETWVFGEQYNLTNSDESLTTVLKNHYTSLGKTLSDESPVLRADGSDAIIDLLLARMIPQPRPEEREHLVVELKRPSVKVGAKELTQTEGYAFAVADDARFRSTATRWSFWVISTEMDSHVDHKTSQPSLPAGCTYQDQRISVWAFTWGQVIERCRSRLQFFQKNLEYEATEVSGKTYLASVHGKYVQTAKGKASP